MCGAAPRGSNGIHPLRSARSKPGLCFAVQDGGPTVTPDFGFQSFPAGGDRYVCVGKAAGVFCFPLPSCDAVLCDVRFDCSWAWASCCRYPAPEHRGERSPLHFSWHGSHRPRGPPGRAGGASLIDPRTARKPTAQEAVSPRGAVPRALVTCCPEPAVPGGPLAVPPAQRITAGAQGTEHALRRGLHWGFPRNLHHPGSSCLLLEFCFSSPKLCRPTERYLLAPPLSFSGACS